MPKVYIAAAFRSLSRRQTAERAYGELTDQNHIDLLEAIEQVFLDYGYVTCLPHRDEGMWGKVYYDPATIGALCFRHVETSDVVFAIAENGRGVHLELGFAAHAKKRLILMFRDSHEPSTLIWGLPADNSPWGLGFGGETEVTISAYCDKADLLTKLRQIFHPSASQDATVSTVRRSLVGVIDVGSHTLKLKVFNYAAGSVARVVHADKNSLGIMSDVTSTGAFSSGTMSTVIEQLRSWQDDCRRLNCEDIVLTGTAALRKATNAGELIELVRQATGLSINVVTPTDELDLVYSAVQATFPSQPCLAVLNLGGGSTQVGLGSGPTPDLRFQLDLGTRHIVDKWPWSAPLSADEFEETVAFAKKVAGEALAGLASKPTALVHTGGELDFLLRCRVPMEVSRLSPLHVSQIPLAHFRRFARAFAALSPDEACLRFGLDPAWAAGSVASNAIATAVAELVGAAVLVPSNMNVADGLLLRHAANG